MQEDEQEHEGQNGRDDVPDGRRHRDERENPENYRDHDRQDQQ